MAVLCLLLGIIFYYKIFNCKFSSASFVFASAICEPCSVPSWKNNANMYPWRGHNKVSVFLCLRQRRLQWWFIFMHDKSLCVLVWCRLYSVPQLVLHHQIKAGLNCNESHVRRLTMDWWCRLRKPILFLQCDNLICIIQSWMPKRNSQNETLTWFILADCQSYFDQIRWDWTDLCCLRWDLITRDDNLVLITFPFVDIHITTSRVILISSYSTCLLLHQSNPQLPISALYISQAPPVIKSAAREQSENER